MFCQMGNIALSISDTESVTPNQSHRISHTEVLQGLQPCYATLVNHESSP